MTPDLVIGIDQSTTATKAIAFDRRGKIIAEGRATVPLSNPKPGWFEQDVADWTGSTAKALKQLTHKIPADRIAAVAIANQRESFAQFAADGKALRPGTLWLDERAHQEVADVAREIGEDQVHKISGIPSDITPSLYRCLWLSRHEPKIWARVKKTAEVHGVLTHFLTGEWKTSTSSASPMGMLNASTYDWSEVLLKAAHVNREQLPQLVAPGHVMGTVTATAAKLTGLKTGIVVVAGGGDGQCAGAGTNTFIKGRAYFNLGTAAVGGNYGKNFAVDRAFRTLVAVADEGYSFETAVRTGTYLVTWFVERMFGINPTKTPGIFAQLEKEAAASSIGANGLVMLPYWSGVMTPHWDTAARGIIAGLSGSHTRGDIYRAMMESLALEQTMMVNRAEAATSPIDHFAIVGGGSKSDLWCQIVADVSGRDVKRLETAEASALGAAMAAARGAGWFKSIQLAAAAMSGKPTKIFRPQKKAHGHYQELLEIHSELWPQISNWNRKLTQFTHRHPS
jgi:sugar (pentulose or hexulose) kinase